MNETQKRLIQIEAKAETVAEFIEYLVMNGRSCYLDPSDVEAAYGLAEGIRMELSGWGEEEVA